MCSVVGCGAGLPAARPGGWNFEATRHGERFVARVVCKMHDQRLRDAGPTSGRRRRQCSLRELWSALWTAAEIDEKPGRACSFVPPEDARTVILRFVDADLPAGGDRCAKYTRASSDSLWTLARGAQYRLKSKKPFPERVSICPQHAVPLRTAKTVSFTHLTLPTICSV